MAPAAAPAADHGISREWVTTFHVFENVCDLSPLTRLAAEAADLLQKLSLNPKSGTGEAKEKVSAALNGVVASANPQVASAEQWGNMATQDYSDASMYYGAYPYYYGGWGDYSVYVSHDGTEALTPGAYGDMYCYPQYGAPAAGHDGQDYGSQHYQYPSTYHQLQTTASKPAYKPKTGKLAPSPQEDVSATAAADQQPCLVDPSKASSNNPDGVKGLKKQTFPLKPSGRASSYQNHGGKTAYPWSGGRTSSEKHQRLSAGNPTSTIANPRNKAVLGQNSPVGQESSGFINSTYSSSGMYNANAYGPGYWYGSHMYGPGLFAAWNALGAQYNPRGKSYGSYGFGNENLDGLNELKRGPRSGLFKNQQVFGAAAETNAKGQELPASDVSDGVVHARYNQADFVETYSDAKFFIIKSYSEDDVHKSIKYNVWASTPNGNKKLDAAYKAAKDNLSTSPVFLFFSVNTSGQFIGLAEMVGPVDFNKTVEYWQQDKWTGCFPVKWHIVKDIPNNLLKHIILEYNENKPVTNSRDTQEVKLEQGLQMIKIFKDHVCKTSMLDDFGFYDNREKKMQDKKSKQGHRLAKTMDVKVLTSNKNSGNEDADGKQGPQKLAVVEEQSDVVENTMVDVNGVVPNDANLTMVAKCC